MLHQFRPYVFWAALLVFCGPMGKSAQVPLHVWLPDAMEGPTPVSALIHAATMVAAGVYLLVSISFLIALVPGAGVVIGWFGIVTAVMAALMATQQSDIKRVLAYSTLSQLGYMVCASGLLAGEAAMFHLFTHAFFKALLFLGAGAIIHALHHEQDMWQMGGLRTKMPITFWTFLVGTLALMGCPGFSGFFSKDAILVAMAQKQPIMCVLGLFTAFLTAFYMARLFTVVFLNKPTTKEVDHAHEVPAVMSLPLVILAVPAVIAGYGCGRAPVRPGRSTRGEPAPGGRRSCCWRCRSLRLACSFWARRWVSCSTGAGRTTRSGSACCATSSTSTSFTRRSSASRRMRSPRFAAWVDRWIIDGLGVRGLSGGVWGGGFVLRFLQVGNLQAYAFFFGLGVLVLVYIAILS